MKMKSILENWNKLIDKDKIPREHVRALREQEEEQEGPDLDLADRLAVAEARAERAEAECERLRALVREAYMEGRDDAPGDYWMATLDERNPERGWLESNARADLGKMEE